MIRRAARWLAALVLPLLAAGAASARVDARPTVQIYPSGGSVPANLLRIELRFSAPLHAPLAVEHVKLLDGEGRQIEDAFLDLPLPSADRRRTTLLLHPGRVKSGVAANVAMGQALVAGSTATLLVDDPQLARPARKTWVVGAVADSPPQPSRWTFDRPRAGSRSPIVVRLDRPISSTAESLIAIRAPDGSRVPGSAALLTGETAWRFVPTRPWRAGLHALVTHPNLEDAAGNRACARFEAILASRIACTEGTVTPFGVR